MSTQATATIYVVNNTGGEAVVAFSHNYFDEPVVQWLGGVPAGGLAGPLTVTFWYGALAAGQDYWFCQAQVLTGPLAGRSFTTEGSLADPLKECGLRQEDAGQVYCFPFGPGGFVMPLLSSPCSTAVTG